MQNKLNEYTVKFENGSLVYGEPENVWLKELLDNLHLIMTTSSVLIGLLPNGHYRIFKNGDVIKKEWWD